MTHSPFDKSGLPQKCWFVTESNPNFEEMEMKSVSEKEKDKEKG